MRLASVLFLAFGVECAAAATKCSDLAAISFRPDVKIESATTVEAKGATPQHCDVRGTIVPENQFAVFLPAEWNGRFVMVGNGGTAGTISLGPMEQQLRKGYASASTNTGHDAKKEPLATFAEHRPDNPNADRKFKDFAFLAVHETAVVAKKIVQAYYGAAPRYSYWVGCSTGGRQGLIEAQRYPEDFDGLVAGAPALDHTGNNMRVLWDGQTQLGAGEIPAAKMPMLADAVYKKCDGVDGLQDGLIDDPRRCDFDPTRDLPICAAGADGAACFTSAQAQALRKIYTGVRNSSGKVIFPGIPPGAEAVVKGKSGWEGNLVGKNLMPLARSESYFKFMFLDPSPAPDWTWRSFNFDTDPARLQRGVVNDNATDPDMRPLKRRGGKILQYHGWADQQITALSSVSYYESAMEHMGVKQTKDFYRLFMVPGMFHCSGGVGCGSVDWLAPLVEWVEHGKAPEMLIGAHVEAGKTTRTRPLCPYPEVARYKGSGSIDEAASFTCVSPKS